MRICIAGAGGTGGHFAVKLAEAGQDVSVIARGAHLAAIQNSGLTLLEGDKTLNQPVRAASDAAELGVQDFVIVGVKATGLQAIAASLAPLIGPRTLVAFPQNGMSWWYPLDLPSHLPPPPHIPIFDRKDDFLPLMEKPQIAGGSIYSANELAAPGIIQNNSPGRNSLTLGLITPGFETELATVQAALRAAGIESPVVADIRRIVWSKLLVNMTGSTIALATESMATVCRTDPALEEIYRRLVEEGLTIAAAYGYNLRDSISGEKLLARMVDHKPSLLQDYEHGRPMEIAEIVQAPAIFARAQNIPAPIMDTLSAVVSRRAKDKGLF